LAVNAQEVALGILPAVISRFVMEKIGKVNCLRYFLTGERFDAKEAMVAHTCTRCLPCPPSFADLCRSSFLRVLFKCLSFP